MDSMELLGILSALMALVAFVGNEYHLLRADNVWYDVLNFLSAVGLFIYAFAIGGTPFLITNSVWAAVSGIDIVRWFLKRRRRINR